MSVMFRLLSTTWRWPASVTVSVVRVLSSPAGNSWLPSEKLVSTYLYLISRKKYLSKTILNQSLDYWTVDAVSAHSSSCKVNDVNHTNTIHSHQNWSAVKNYFSSSKLFQVIICGTSTRTRPGWSRHEEEDWDFTGGMSRFPQPMTWSSSRSLQTTVITTLQLDLWVRIGF